MDGMCYLARPIDRAGHKPELQQACDRMVVDLTAAGYRVYQPATAWTVPGASLPTTVIEDVNGHALSRADLLVAYLPPEVPSIGVPMEIQRAIQLDIPVIAVTEPDSYALARPQITVIDGVLDGQLTVALAELDETIVEASLRRQQTDHQIRLVIREGHELPFRSYPDDAGLDLTTVQTYVIEPGRFVDVHTQVDATQLPAGYWGMITGRSSALRRWGLFVPTGVIDPGWRGPLFIGVWNLGDLSIKVEPGMRLGQLILIPNNPAPVLAVDRVGDALRGTQGFGSSG